MQERKSQKFCVEENGNSRYYLIIDKVIKWLLSHNYKGFDPYDGLNNQKLLKIRIGYPYLHILLIQFNKYSPISFRKILGIKPGVDVKAMSLILQSYVILYELTRDPKYEYLAGEICEMLLSKSLYKKYGYHAWASHYFSTVKIDGTVKEPSNYDIIGTSNVIKALSLYYIVMSKKDDRIHSVIKSSLKFMETLIKKMENMTYFVYEPSSKNKIVPNATAVAVEAIYYGLKVTSNSSLYEKTKEAVHTLLNLQESDGSWPYAIYFNGKIRYQNDFHQGFIIDGLLKAMKLFPEMYEEIDGALNRAVNFYFNMFDDGKSFYMYPNKRYPVDIHNQAQGIITFSNLYHQYHDEKYLKKAIEIADWTIKNMWDNKGFFYAHKWPLLTNKIPYIRWSQAWMLLSLSTLLKNVGDQNESSCGE